MEGLLPWRLAAEGAHVVVNDIVEDRAVTVARQTTQMGHKSLATCADMSKYEQVRELVRETVEKLGTIDILVNNAGVLLPTALEEISEEEWDWVMDVNVKGVFLCTKAVLATIKVKGGSKIVNMASSAGRSTSTFGGAHYTTSKAAVLGLTRHTAREMAPYHINVNSVSPRSTDTEMVRENSTPERMASEAAKVPLGRLGAPEDVADPVLFLASEEACYITGRRAISMVGT